MKMHPILNDDGVSVRGCNYIYAPKGQAGEYAPLATNPYRGCGNGCVYCYVPLITKQDRREFDAGAVSRRDYLANLRKDAEKYRAAGIREQVMFSFTTDVYNPGNRELTRPAIQVLRDNDLGFCVLTKGGTRALEDLDLYRPERDAFASTLTSLDDGFSKKWERNAALPADRLAALRAFHAAGIFTWVSLEPTLNTEASLAIVQEAHGFVDLWKVGRANYLKDITATTDWHSYTLRMLDLLNRLNAHHYIKRDLQQYLPLGYHNPMRILQHR
jgi:DNA repair photolyase